MIIYELKFYPYDYNANVRRRQTADDRQILQGRPDMKIRMNMKLDIRVKMNMKLDIRARMNVRTNMGTGLRNI